MGVAIKVYLLNFNVLELMKYKTKRIHIKVNKKHSKQLEPCFFFDICVCNQQHQLYLEKEKIFQNRQ